MYTVGRFSCSIIYPRVERDFCFIKMHLDLKCSGNVVFRTDAPKMSEVKQLKNKKRYRKAEPVVPPLGIAYFEFTVLMFDCHLSVT